MGIFDRWTTTKDSVRWNELETEQQWNELLEASHSQAIALFKHSTRCSISAMAKSRFERDFDFENESLQAYYLDLIQNRSVSNKIASDLGVQHESPQLIVIKEGKAVYHASHGAISAKGIQAFL